MRFTDDDRIYNGPTLPEIVVEAPNLQIKNRYMAVSGRYYHDHPGKFREAIRFMQRIGDVEGERYIFMKCFNAGRERAFQKVVLPMVGVMAFPFVVEACLILASSPAVYSTATKLAPYFRNGWTYSKKVTYLKMGFNAYLQTKLADDGYRDIDMIAVVAEGLPLGWKALSNVAEWKPFKENKEERFIYITNGKSVSEILWDMSTEVGSDRLLNGISSKARQISSSAMEDRTFRNGVNIFFKPMFSTFYEIFKQATVDKGKKYLLEDKEKDTK